jgi:hypothetical protein
MARFFHIAWITPEGEAEHGVSFSRRVGVKPPKGAIITTIPGYMQRPGAELLLVQVKKLYPEARLIESAGPMSTAYIIRLN